MPYFRVTAERIQLLETYVYVSHEDNLDKVLDSIEDSEWDVYKQGDIELCEHEPHDYAEENLYD